MKRFYHMRALLLAATAALALTPSAYAQVIGTGNSFDAGRDQIGIVRDGTFEGYATPASLLTWVQTNITFPPDCYPTSASLVGTTLQIGMSLGPTLAVDLSSLDESAAVMAVQNSLNAHVAADLDLDPTNERGVLGNGTNGNITYQPYPGAPVATVVQSSETVTGTAAANTLARGLSLGSVDKPVGSAATMADVTGSNPGLDVSYGSMQALFTNRAAEGGAAGMMNSDGSLGAYSKYYATPAAAIDGGNFGTVGIAIANGTTAIPNGNYDGQLLVLHMTGNGEQILTGSFRGVLRNSQHEVTDNTVVNSIIVRPTEHMILEWGGTTWRAISYNFHLADGSGWHENANGTITAHFSNTPSPNTTIPAGDELITDMPLPVTMSSNGYQFSCMDRNNTISGTTVGLTSPTNGALLTQHYVPDSTTTDARLAIRNISPSGTNTPGTMTCTLYGRPDYAALGLLASF